MDTDTTPAPEPMELPQNPVDGTWGFICREHGISRNGLTERHAQNVAALHAREQHADPLAIALDLQAGAIATARLSSIDRYYGALEVWQAMTGLADEALEGFLNKLTDAPEPVTAAVAPF